MTLIPVLMYHAIGDDVGADLAGYVHMRSEFARHLADCKTRLEATLSAPVNTFAYPFGFHSMATRGAVRRAGFRLGLALSDRPANIGQDDRRALPRLTIPPRSCDEDVLILLKRSRSPTHDSLAEAKRVAWRWKRRGSNPAPRRPPLR